MDSVDAPSVTSMIDCERSTVSLAILSRRGSPGWRKVAMVELKTRFDNTLYCGHQIPKALPVSAMFYYLSFLHPPPSEATDSIEIIPLITTDRNRNIYNGTRDIFYAWMLSSSSHLVTTTPVKLASPRGELVQKKRKKTGEETTQKAISVPLPLDAQPGQSWRLILMAKLSQSEILLGSTSSIGREPFPVISMPIQVVSKLSKSAGKREECDAERVYVLPEYTFTMRERISFSMETVRGRVCDFPHDMNSR